MIDLQSYYEKAKAMAKIVQHVMINELKLMPPKGYLLTERNGLVWLVVVMDALNLGRNIDVYADKKTLHHLSTVLRGAYVGLANHNGLRYAILLSPRPQLPARVEYDGVFEPDVFRLGVNMMGRELRISAHNLRNVLIGAPPGAGKSNLLTLIAQTARASGWKLYLADPQGHTFNPDAWNGIAAAPVAGGLDELRKLLGLLEAEHIERQALFRAAARNGIPPADIDEYNRVGPDPLARFVLLFDEANTWLDDVLDEITDLARQIRKFGGHIVLVGHDWHGSDVPKSLSAQFYTRIGMSSNDDTSARVVLSNAQWGKWLAGKPVGRAVLRTDGFMPMQIYVVPDELQQTWMSAAAPNQPALDQQTDMIVRKAMAETNGKISLEVLMAWGLGQGEARRLQDDWRERGWAENDPSRKNGLYITSKLTALLTSLQTLQAPTNALQTPQTGQQTAYKLTNSFYGAGAAD